VREARHVHEGRGEGAGPPHRAKLRRRRVQVVVRDSEVLKECESILVAKSIRLLIKHKGKQWYLSESAGEIGEISFRAEAEA